MPPRASGEPVFELLALGVLGGDEDSNLSAYLLGRPGKTPRLLIDGGTVVNGVARWKARAGTLPETASWPERAQAAQAMLSELEAFLVTHAHLDHLAGFVLASPLLLGHPAPRAHSLRVIGLPATLEAMHRHLLNRDVWFDLSVTPPHAPAIRFEPLAPLLDGSGHRPADNRPVLAASADGFSIEAVETNHPVPCAAYFIRDPGGAIYVHCGDTGPTERLWERARPLLTSGTLRGLSIEVSFSSRQEALARLTGHLTPTLLLLELAKLTATDADPIAVARALGGLPILATHVKATEHTEVERELEDFRRAGIDILLPVQGECYRF
jgi:3',5'-cyclic-nucleotide phosphodiesterase